MGLFNFLFGAASSTSSAVSNSKTIDINPATGLPMTSGIGSVDVAGNPYGTDLNDSISGTSMDDNFTSMDTTDCFTDSLSSFDDSCSSFDDW